MGFGCARVLIHSRASFAFTVVEVLVSIGILVILLGILVPVLASARSQARTTVTISNLRQAGLTFQQYLGQYSETYPFAEPGQWLSLEPNGRAQTLSSTYPFQLRMSWPALMHEIAPWREHYSTWVNPGAPIEPGEPWKLRSDAPGTIRDYDPSYHYSHAFQARPRLFAPNPPTSADELIALIRPVRTADVSHPSNKALLYDAKREYLTRTPRPSDPRAVLAADGSVVMRLDDDAIPPIPTPFIGGRGIRYSDTPGGAGGRDW